MKPAPPRGLVIVAPDPITAYQVRQAIESYAYRVGPDNLADGYRALLASIREQPEAPERSTLESVVPPLLTRQQVAEMAGVSPSTVTRWGLPKVGRRYPATAVRQHLQRRETP